MILPKWAVSLKFKDIDTNHGIVVTMTKNQNITRSEMSNFSKKVKRSTAINFDMLHYEYCTSDPFIW